MDKEIPDMEGTERPRGKFEAAALRAIDAGMRGVDRVKAVLQGLRNRLGEPGDEEGDTKESRRRSPFDEEVGQETLAPRSSSSFLQDLLILLMIALIGGAIGAFVSYRGFSKQIEGHDLKMEILNDELSASRKAESRLINENSTCRMEIGDYRKELREIEQELDSCKARPAEPGSKPNTTKSVGRTATREVIRDDRVGTSSRAKQVAPQNTGTCVTGGDNVTENLANCLKALNR